MTVLDQPNIIARDFDATVEFYRRLGMELKEAPGSHGIRHAEAQLENGTRLEIDNGNLARIYNAAWRKPQGSSRAHEPDRRVAQAMAARRSARIGLIFDAHGLEALRAIAPVSAVRGNNDRGAWARGPHVSGRSHRPKIEERAGSSIRARIEELP